MRRRLRAFGAWVADYRTGGVVVASVLVALLALVVVDIIQARQASDRRADQTLAELQDTVTELQRRGQRIDDLARQLENATASRDLLAEEVRALRELLIDRGMLKPRPQQTPAPGSPRRPGDPPGATQGPSAGPAPTLPSPRPQPAPQPAPSPAPPPAPAPPPPSPAPAPGGPLPGVCDALPVPALC